MTAAVALAPTRTARVESLSLDEPRWLHFVENCADAGPFHHPRWANLLAECYGFQGRALVLSGASGEVTAGLPVLRTRRRWTSLPFTDVCAPLTTTAISEERLSLALDDARRRAGIARLEIRTPLEGANVYRSAAGVLHSLALDEDPARVFARFSRSNVQRQVRKGDRSGLTVTRGSDSGALADAFYELHVLTRRRLGVPVQPRRFFRLLWDRMLAHGLGFVLLAHAGEQAVAGAVFLAWNGHITYKFGASRPEFWKLCPNHLLMWSAIRWGCEEGFHTFDFGRTDVEDTGLRRFKSGWGTDEQPLVYSTIADVAPRQGGGRFTKALRPVLRRSPLWVVRAVGASLYRYAA